MCTFQRPDVRGTERLTYTFKPELKMITIEILSGNKNFQLLTRRDFDDENNFVPSCESVESVVMAAGDTTPAWITSDRTRAVSDLAGTTRNPTEYCPPEFPFILEQSPTRLKVDCLYRGIGDAIIVYLSPVGGQCIGAVNVEKVDSLCRSIDAWTKNFVDRSVAGETENRRRNRERNLASNPSVDQHFLREQILERRAYFEEHREVDFWDLESDGENFEDD